MDFLRLPDNVEAEFRRQLRTSIAAITPPEHVDMIVDVAMHSARASLEAAQRVLESAGDDRIFMAALGPALGLIRGQCATLEAGLRSYAKANSLNAKNVSLRFQETVQ